MAETVVVVEMVGEEKEVVVEMAWEKDMEDASCEEDGSYEEGRMMILGRQRMAIQEEGGGSSCLCMFATAVPESAALSCCLPMALAYTF
ncbi:unnamed protein product, partial [Sphagnum compactum]